MRRRFHIAVIALLLGAGAALAEPSVWERVWRSETAPGASVVGRVRIVSLAGERTAVARVRAAGGKLRLDYEVGPRRWSLVDDGQHLTYLDPARQVAVALPRPTLAVDRKLAERNYEARLVGESAVGGRPTQVVEIVPRGGGPAVLRLWLDRESGFPLRRERYNVEGRLTSGTIYEEVEFGARVEPEAFLVPEGWRKVPPRGEVERLTVADLSKVAGFVVREPGYIPQRYVLLGGYRQEWGRLGLRMAELRYTDGLRMLSVFQRQRGEEGPGMGERGRGYGGGRGRAHGRGRGWGRGGGRGLGPGGGELMTLLDRGSERALRYFGRERVVVVVGDVTEEELERVARSVE